MSSEDNKKKTDNVADNDKDRLPDEALSGVSGGGQREVTRPLIDSGTKRIFGLDNIKEIQTND
ncbi:MAG: hypothetical protein K5655_02345 [Lachnospiraceae bacterium]|nr:hypothetical protein [Lachnospiraceae bacterium]